MKRPWTKTMGVLGVLWLAFLVLLVRSSCSRSTPAPPSSAAPPPASAAPAAGKARRRATEPKPREPGSIAGRVAEPAGAPVAGALVCAAVEPAAPGAPPPAEAREPVCAPSAEDGRYALSGLPPARWTITASAPHHRPARYASTDAARTPFVELGAGEARAGVDLVLPAGGVEVRGQVEDIGGGAISGALVTLDWLEPGMGSVVARSDAQGRYAAWIDEGPYFARALADGYAEAFRDGVAPGPSLKLLLTPASALVGRVVEAGTGTPVEGATISLDSEGAWGPMHGMPAARSDAEGRFRVDRLAPGRYRLVARALGKLGQARESVLLGLGQTSREVVIEVHPARVVAGRVDVALDGAPCKRGNVALLSPGQAGIQSAAIEADGSVLFDAVLRGSYEVLVACADHVAEPTYPVVEVGDADIEDLVWTVRAGLAIRGRVVDRDQNPVLAAVHAYAPAMMGARGATGAAARTEADGTFALKGLAPAKYMIMTRPVSHAEPAPVEVELRDERAPEVTIVVDRGGAIEGIVVDEDRKPVAGVNVSILGTPPDMGAPGAAMGPMRPPAGGMARSLDDGSFAMRGLPPGDYRVSASDAPPALPPPGPGALGAAPQAVSARVEAGASARVTLVVERRNGEIHGRVVDDIGEPVTDAFVHAERELGGASPPGARNQGRARWGAFAQSPVLTDPEGKFVVGSLPQGTYTVHAYRKGGGEAFAEHVHTGDSVTLTLKPAGAISGTLSVPSGKVPEQFTVRALERETALFRAETFAFTGGAFTISDLPEGKYELSTETQEGTAAVDVALAPGEQRSGVVLALAPRASLTGQVVSLDGGAPIAGVRINVYPRKGGPSVGPGSFQQEIRTDEAGRFEVNQAPSGPIMLVCAPSDPMGSPYDIAVLPVDAQPGAATDVGRVVMAKRRVGPENPPGDLGFSIKDAFAMDLPAQTLEVSEVRPGGPAARAGLQVGDAIVSVDGHDVRGKMAYLYRPLSTVPAGTQVTLGLSRGAAVSITAGEMRMPPGLPAGVPAR
ncbi:carboxypeptidase regulatory-like domain-containing protein [Sorangium sp. So ce394]|uniref:carboxypeptidase regulatory-like domain-containing protein n=1 Tax=Sorangium sp. So ce394 TaxID=3133310 RepID=UPI003F5B0841